MKAIYLILCVFYVPVKNVALRNIRSIWGGGVNAAKFADKTKRFLIKQWFTKTVTKDGSTQSFLSWKFVRCNYEELVDMLMDDM